MNAKPSTDNSIHVTGNQVGRDLTISTAADPRRQPDTTSQRTVILFLSANPADTAALRVDRELREVDAAIRDAPCRDVFDLRRHGAVRTQDLRPLLQREQPAIVHFSGHADRHSRILLENDRGDTTAVPTDALANLFSLFADTIRCVVLNACYSEEQATAISESIPAVIGMPAPVDDEIAIRFAAAFYGAVAYGRNLDQAFKFGCFEVGAAADHILPRLLVRKGSDPKTMTFT